ncbi:hypothetical protein [Actinomadura sp. WMMA1423]|uniref:hypothetical protein n=1 Tax=Actinomadura sp. WMMA1423 TaxID=2591108 RepID=UPI001146AAB8|nr:hypothetical protein [Actinomadura sp. WMMA1423]
MLCVMLAACGGSRDKGAEGAPFGAGNPSGPPGATGTGEQPQGHGAPYRVPNYGAEVDGADLADPEQWAEVRKWLLEPCPGGTECVHVERRYQPYDGRASGCKLFGTEPAAGTPLEYGQTIVALGSAPCSGTSGPSPEVSTPIESPPVESPPVESPPVESPAPVEGETSPASVP